MLGHEEVWVGARWVVAIGALRYTLPTVREVHVKLTTIATGLFSVSFVLAIATQAHATCNLANASCYHQTNINESGIGIQGNASGSEGKGLYGQGGMTGVFGSGTQYGVQGVATNDGGYGVQGYSGTTAGQGLRGWSQGSGGYGVVGFNNSTALNGTGVYGSAAAYGVYGSVSAVTGTAVYGNNNSASGWAGYFNGRVFSTAGYSSSDARLKKDIVNLGYGMAQVSALRPVKFKWKSGEGGDQLGLIAQEVEKVLPELVDHGSAQNGGMMSVNYTGIIPVILKGMQEQQKIIAEQQKLIQRLDARVAEAERSPNAMQASLLGSPFNTGLALCLIPLGFFFAKRRRSPSA
jgi:hypothetical protein